MYVIQSLFIIRHLYAKKKKLVHIIYLFFFKLHTYNSLQHLYEFNLNFCANLLILCIWIVNLKHRNNIDTNNFYSTL